MLADTEPSFGAGTRRSLGVMIVGLLVLMFAAVGPGTR